MCYLLATYVQTSDYTLRSHFLQNVPRKRPSCEKRVHFMQDLDFPVELCQPSGELYDPVND